MFGVVDDLRPWINTSGPIAIGGGRVLQATGPGVKSRGLKLGLAKGIPETAPRCSYVLATRKAARAFLARALAPR